MKDLFQEVMEGFCHFFELGENKDLLSFFIDGFADFTKSLKFAALFFFKSSGPEVLVRMIADLLELHQRRKDQALSLNPFCFLDGFSNVLNQLSIEKDLFSDKGGIDLHLHLFREVGDDRLVGLEAPQNVRVYDLAQSGIPRWILAQIFCEFLELPGVSQKPGIQKVKQGPEVRQTVLDGGAGHDDPVAGNELLDDPCLLCPRILDGLGLVQNDVVPGMGLKP